MRLKKLLILLPALFLVGCAGTSQVLPKPTDGSVCVPGKARIRVHRLASLNSAGWAAPVYDTGRLIGNLGSDGTIVWDRPSGTAVIEHVANKSDLGSIQLKVEPCKQYNLQMRLKWSGAGVFFDLLSVDSLSSENLQQGFATGIPEKRHNPPVERSVSHFNPESIAEIASTSLMVKNLTPQRGVDKQTADSLSSILRSALSEYYDVQSLDALAAINQVVEEKLKAGCDDTKCIMEVAGALDIGLVVTGDISRFGNLYTLNLMLISTQGTKLGVIARSSEECECSEQELVGFAKRAALKLIGNE